jgi:hypothetical protein
MQQAVSARTPAHLWIVGILSLLWNAFGGWDYLMSRTHNIGWAKMTMPGSDPAAMFAYVDSMPLIASIGWGLGVWCSLAAAVLLLMRSRYAVYLYAVSLLGAILSFGYQLFIAKNVPAQMSSPVVPAIIVALILLQLWYSWTMEKKGVLR